MNEELDQQSTQYSLPEPVAPDHLLAAPVPAVKKPSLLRDSVVLAIIIILLGLLLYPVAPRAAEEMANVLNPEEKELIDPFKDIVIQGKAAYVFDAVSGGILYEKHADEELPLASLTKIMTAVTALSLIPEYTVVRIRPEFLRAEGDTGLFSEERWELKDLLQFTLITSSNDGATAIASVAGSVANGNEDFRLGRETFIEKMNAQSRELGLTMRFSNETGLDVSQNESGGYGSAKDVAQLFALAVQRYPFLFETTGKERTTLYSLNNIEHQATNTNQVVNSIPMLVGSKTGFTDLAGGNLVVAFDVEPARPVIIVVLGSTLEGRFEDVSKLAAASISYVTENY